MSNKTISINPSLFSVGGSKTKKNREKKTKPTSVPLISPSVLKNKLLKRIKEHKQKETQNLENNKRKLEPKIEEFKPAKKIDDGILNFNDEFNDSINYLHSLSKQRQLNEEKRSSELLKQKQKEELERRTVRNYHSMGGQSQSQGPIINMDLPEELVQPVIPTNTEIFHIKTKDDVPYGVLKGGIKPSYREWSKTQRNNIVTNPNASLIIEGGNVSSEKTARENRLNLLKQKIKNKTAEMNKDPLITENLIKKPIELQISPQIAPQIAPQISQPFSPQISQPFSPQIPPPFSPQIPPQISPQIPPPFSPPMLSQIENPNQEQNGGKLIATKHITKKTIKRKYTLGRSKIKKTVSVLIKDRFTRKRVLNAQKDLKRKNINDIRAYLREHNLIKTGSNAPNDVLRKLYESAMLSGEITNSNSDILLHNFSKDDKEL
jgi:hypothetical protein